MFIFNPRIFREFIKVAREYNMDFEVINDICDYLRHINESRVLIIDKEGINIIKSICSSNQLNKLSNIEGNLIILEHLKDVRKVILSTLGGSTKPVLICGIDIGKKLAYAILSNDILVEFGYCATPEDVIKRIKQVSLEISPQRIIVQVGKPSNKELVDVAYYLLSLSLDEGFETYLVDESKSSKEISNYLKPSLKGIAIPKDNNIRAAISLALRRVYR